MKTDLSTANRAHGLPKSEQGFTLLELLIAMAITAILIGIAIPNLGEYSSSSAVRSKVSALEGAMRLARAEAIKRGNRVTICPSNDTDAVTPTCAGGNQWNSGWIVFSDTGAPNVFDAGTDQLIRVQAMFTDPGTIVSTGGGAVNFSLMVSQLVANVHSNSKPVIRAPRMRIITPVVYAKQSVAQRGSRNLWRPAK